MDRDDDRPRPTDRTPRKAKGWLRRLLGSTLGDDEEPPPAEPIAPMEGEEDHWVDVSLEQMLAREPDLPVHVVSLSQYREALGANWDKLGDKVMILAESVLRRLQRDGAMVTQFDDFFVIAFTPAMRPLGPKLTSDAVIQLGQRLVGVKFSILAQGGPQLGFSTVTGAQLRGAGGAIDSAKLTAIAADAPPVAVDPTRTSSTTSVGTARHVTTEAIPAGDMGPENVWVPLPPEVTRPPQVIEMKPIDPPRKKRPEPQWVPLKRD